MSTWTDAIVGDRMAVDREFDRRIRQSEFTGQEWGLIMTAIELEIERADDPDRARLVADAGNLPAIMPELEAVRSQVPTAGDGRGGRGRGGGGRDGGVVDAIRGALGLGGDDGDDDRLRAAERLTQEYADELQAHLESEGKWERVRRAYLDDVDADEGDGA